uniref:Oxidation resistance protein 1 n=2 Tax=Craspedostauros australis TaxID=1486917 RepID=A0A7R9WWF2_9STRA|mmetsp:Transcript_21576/g.60053  ORF Transcript_21576/g.60053 Transcript_21576/m.60053 type:complete len:502 (+) Transcript_21576:307-1812(+)
MQAQVQMQVQMQVQLVRMRLNQLMHYHHHNHHHPQYHPIATAATTTTATTTAAPVDEYSRVARLETFFDGIAKCGRRGNKAVLEVLMECCQPQEAPPESAQSSLFMSPVSTTTTAASHKKSIYVDPYELVNMGHRIGLATAFLKAAEEDDDMGMFIPPKQEGKDSDLLALAKSLQRCASSRRYNTQLMEFVSKEDVLEWSEMVAPMFASTLSTFFFSLLFPGRSAPPSRSSFDYPKIPAESTFFRTPSSPLLFSFGCMSVSLGGEFYRLYTSAADGLSFNRLQNSLLGYGGPTLIIIQSGDCIFGAFTASPWKESKDFYGNSDCFLYQAVPTMAVYRPTISNSNFMYCNSHARSKGYDQQAHGIGFGGTTDQPRLFIAETFDDCRASNRDLTFDNGSLLSATFETDHFEIDNLEVWGVGGTDVVQEALGARDRQRDIRASNIRKARKVDKAAFLDDLRSGLIESKAFAHREQIRGRDDVCIDPDDDKNYLHPNEKKSGSDW